MARLEGHGLTRRPWFEGRALALEAGEVVCLRGATGSGKTLFLRAIADLDPLDGGELTLDGEARASLSPARWRRDVLYLHPTPPRLEGSVRMNVECVLELACRKGAVAPELDGFDPGAPILQLSSGEAQLLALRRALACRPRVLLLDEATSALDAARGAEAERAVLRFCAEGGAALWVTHDAELAGRLGAREEAFP